MIAEALKTKTLELRKGKHDLASFAVAVQSKAQDLAKAADPANPTVTDAHATSAIRSFIKSAEENMRLLQGMETAPGYLRSQQEVELLKALLPVPATDEQVEAAVKQFLDNPQLERGPKLIGPIMGFLKQRFGNTLDAGRANKIIQAQLAQ